MIAGSGKGNFLAAHYDWVAAAVGVLVLAGAVAYCFLGGSIEERIDEVTARIGGRSPTAAVEAADTTGYAAVTNVARAKSRANAVVTKAADFFASGKRLRCRNAVCGRATPEKFDGERNLICAFCGFTQEVAKAETVLDADGDGIPDAWERKYGLNPHDASDATADKDGDGFTNLEEFEAKTDPTDPNDHPDPLDWLTLTPPLKETYMPFVLVAANQIPSGWRCEFFDAKQKDDYGRTGRTLTAVVGEEIGKSGYVLKSYEKKSVKRAIKGSVNQKEVDVSEAVVERKRDGKLVTLVRAENRRAKPAPVDVQATLSFAREGGRTFEVVPGAELTLCGVKYRIREIKAEGKRAKVVVETVATAKQRVLEALEP
ncbi:MAG: Amuc_1099 family pilus-like system protein [Kiritimatiellia bacterium]